jgi:adenosylmethionine-8-amino-7-oxononanoate aminotransferase
VALAARAEGAIVRNLGDAVVILPPLVATEPELDALVGAVERALWRVLPA